MARCSRFRGARGRGGTCPVHILVDVGDRHVIGISIAHRCGDVAENEVGIFLDLVDVAPLIMLLGPLKVPNILRDDGIRCLKEVEGTGGWKSSATTGNADAEWQPLWRCLLLLLLRLLLLLLSAAAATAAVAAAAAEVFILCSCNSFCV